MRGESRGHLVPPAARRRAQAAEASAQQQQQQDEVLLGRGLHLCVAAAFLDSGVARSGRTAPHRRQRERGRRAAFRMGSCAAVAPLFGPR